jgi:hypothetical protein
MEDKMQNKEDVKTVFRQENHNLIKQMSYIPNVRSDYNNTIPSGLQ